MMNKIENAVDYGISLLGTPYKLWGGGACEKKEPMWAKNGPVPKKDEITSCNCAGLINLILRFSGKKIPARSLLEMGGTPDYEYVYKKKSIPIDINYNYPVGTLLVRNYRDYQDQGHVAMIIENKGKYSKILQSHYYKPNNDNGVNIKYTLEESHNGYYYEYAVLPENWLL